MTVFAHPEVILCSGQDVKVQFLTNSFMHIITLSRRLLFQAQQSKVNRNE